MHGRDVPVPEIELDLLRNLFKYPLFIWLCLFLTEVINILIHKQLASKLVYKVAILIIKLDYNAQIILPKANPAPPCKNSIFFLTTGKILE